MGKTLIGEVTSTAPDKTAVIAVNTRKTHPLYKKQYTVTKKFMAHDEENSCKVGDRVRIVETRPISARKRFKLDKILERATLTQEDLKALETENGTPDEPKKDGKDTKREVKDISKKTSHKKSQDSNRKTEEPPKEDAK